MSNNSSYDSFARTFSASREHHPWPEIETLLDHIEEMSRDLGGDIHILDVGCGNGRFLDSLVQRECSHRTKYLGIDSSEGMIGEAQRLHPGYTFSTHSMLDLDSLTVPIGGWSVILFLASFHHLDSERDRLSVLHQVRKMLSERGKVMMTNWNLLDQEKYQSSSLGNGDFSIKIGAYSRYYHGFTLSEWENLFQMTWFSTEMHQISESGRNILSILRWVEK